MSYLECNPNHCPSVIEMGKSLVVQELKINELEAEKAELLEFVKDIIDYEAERVLSEREKLLQKHEIKP